MVFNMIIASGKQLKPVTVFAKFYLCYAYAATLARLQPVLAVPLDWK